LYIHDHSTALTLDSLPPSKYFSCASLRDVELHGSWGQYKRLFLHLDFPSLHILSLHLEQLDSWKCLLNMLSGRLTQLAHLSITVVDEPHPPLLSDHITGTTILPWLSSLTQIRFIGAESHLSDLNFMDIFKLQRALTHFVVGGPGSEPIHISKLQTMELQQVRELYLPLDLTGMIKLPDNPRPPNEVLRHIYLDDETIMPKNFWEKIGLAKYLFRLFPSARVSPLTENVRGVESICELDDMIQYLSGKCD
jgi:hypothetical protein